ASIPCECAGSVSLFASHNLRLGAVRRLAYEAADCGLLSPDLAAGIRRVKGVKKIGVRLGNWLTAEQSQRLWQAPGGECLKEKRDRALLAVWLACGLRRHEAVELNFGHVQQREEHWAIVDLKGKAGHLRTIPVPPWVKNVLDQWLQAANITSGKLFRRVHKMGKAWGERLTEKAVWHVVREYAAKAAIDKLAPHNLRGLVHGFATPREANWSRFSFCSVTFRFRQPNDISVVNSGFKVPSTTKSE
ncbi:MAG TPA: tyrosine-type recombinase/integrase, partial [Candidatus Sulfotelmatobacter sp.]|nr:tyrosine-type recombinase/integrase [Candidatus Sulfotelmatobacter sp.]